MKFQEKGNPLKKAHVIRNVNNIVNTLYIYTTENEIVEIYQY